MTAAKGVAVLRGEGLSSGVKGVVRFHQPHGGDASATTITGQIEQLTPGKYALRILLFGDESETNFKNLGGVYNPFSRSHGDKDDAERPVGALGSVEAGADGIATFEFSDKLVRLVGPLSVLGRAVALCQQHDDTQASGAGQTASSAAADGNTGPIIAAGVIGIAAMH